MPVVRARAGVWCDYCRVRYPKGLLSQKGASWTVISESKERRGRERHYCQSCAEEVSKWGEGIWELQDQINYTIGKEELGNV